MALTETSICNMALARIGANRITATEFAADPATNNDALHCVLHYSQTRDALLRSYHWRFASDRKTLVRDTNSPDFEWDYQYILPTDYLRRKSVYDSDAAVSRNRRFDIEGQRYLTNDSTVNLRYIRKVTDVTEFDPLFVEVLVLLLAKKLVGSLAGADAKLTQDIKDDLKRLMPKALAVDADETNVGGRSDWNLARKRGIGIASEDERYW